tara:strand:+ start:2499 stop:3410 length:912 start_codon:yes stop_codon:yes gene_type:complete
MLQLNLSNNTAMTIELVDDPFVEAWARNVANLALDKTEHTALGARNDHYPTDQWNRNIEELCRELPRWLSRVGLSVPEFFPSLSTLRGLNNTTTFQHHMNQIHRWLVFCMFREPYYVDGVNYLPENLNSLFDANFDGMLTALFTLNQCVHVCEEGYTSPGLETFPGNAYGKTMWDQGFTQDDKIGWAKDLNYNHLLTNNNHDVWLAKRILGKDFRECWLDADDPSYRDITNTGDILHYCFEVDPLNDDSEFYNSDEFASWMTTHDRSIDVSEIGRIPLGNIIDKPADLEYVMNHCHIESIELV